MLRVPSNVDRVGIVDDKILGFSSGVLRVFSIFEGVSTFGVIILGLHKDDLTSFMWSTLVGYIGTGARGLTGGKDGTTRGGGTTSVAVGGGGCGAGRGDVRGGR